ncbi:hypothetical protein EYF80_028146 [Liparis tanakae]|uniref:Uncharacterized protein n=1 Tax=Liparis tanakae TaxID=230148 RepID=A0A4Z2H7M4_9TELE|nr:hypothetical protein EYF80_028146 [Liparis tanakae]
MVDDDDGGLKEKTKRACVEDITEDPLPTPTPRNNRTTAVVRSGKDRQCCVSYLTGAPAEAVAPSESDRCG